MRNKRFDSYAAKYEKKRFDSYAATIISVQIVTDTWMTPVALAANKCEAFLGHLNLVEPTIQFTLERELDGKLPFLDVLLEHHPDGTISTSVFRKSTHTDRYLDYGSHHPLAQRSAILCTLQHRAEVLSSTQEALDEEKSHVADALLKNGYPRWLIR